MRVDRLLSSKRFYLTDGGLETYMVFDEGFELPCFSAAALLETERGRSALTAYFERFIAIAQKSGRGYVMDAPTWRAGTAWAGPLGMSVEDVLAINRKAAVFVDCIRRKHETPELPIILNGLVGPSGDAYAPENSPDPDEAFHIHAPQVQALGKAGVDMVSAMTLPDAREAIGIIRAANEIDLPVVISFTLETDGCLPSGQPLAEAIDMVDRATSGGAAYFMINCAHPDHFRSTLDENGGWRQRIGGLRTNASRLSHAELDEAEELDAGDPIELGDLHNGLLQRLPNIRLIGGCCGTDHRHVACLAGLDEVEVAGQALTCGRRRDPGSIAPK
ncbi:MAG: homocysteine S-methyltransferase family protein [Parvibaculaceae bacterium]|jgi:homocysteine S-methyltransferase